MCKFLATQPYFLEDETAESYWQWLILIPVLFHIELSAQFYGHIIKEIQGLVLQQSAVCMKLIVCIMLVSDLQCLPVGTLSI